MRPARLRRDAVLKGSTGLTRRSRRSGKWGRAALSGLLAVACVCGSAQAAQTVKITKKGFDTAVRPDGNWRRQIVALHAHWFYSWGGDEPKGIPQGVEFVPMEWGYYGNKGNGTGKWLAKVKAQPGVRTLLGFNEPDGKDQANLGVDSALEGWPLLMQTGLALGSPAAVHADGDWMQQFMRGADQKHYRVDFVTIHWYGGPDAAGFLGYLAKVHAMYHRPLWVTEFAPADWSGHRGVSPQQAADFLRAVLPAMNKLDYVQRYSWYSADAGDAALGAGALFNADGTLTSLGRLYAASP